MKIYTVIFSHHDYDCTDYKLFKSFKSKKKAVECLKKYRELIKPLIEMYHNAHEKLNSSMAEYREATAKADKLTETYVKKYPEILLEEVGTVIATAFEIQISELEG